MPKVRTFNGLALSLTALIQQPDGSYELKITAQPRDTDGARDQSVDYWGWDGTTAAQRTSLRNALVAVLTARTRHILSTDPATHDVVFQSGEFVESPK